MLYFSYGSFLDYETLKRHCPGGKFVTRAFLPNWEVQFNYMSKTYGAGVTGIEPAPRRLVRGVIYDVPPEEMEHIDVIEAVPEGFYYRQRILVVGDEGNLLEVETYRTTHPQGPFKPSKRYLGLMVKGAREHGLDPEYVRELEAVETIN
jgi:gamma-glutamylcyclotransferase (GGCT)/AIG2-like uncharacterized protein YtfP